jgi:hypothetical protein
VTSPVAESTIQLTTDSLEDSCRLMPQNHRPKAKRVVDILVAVDIEQMRPTPSLEADRDRLLHCSKRCRNTTSERS